MNALAGKVSLTFTCIFCLRWFTTSQQQDECETRFLVRDMESLRCRLFNASDRVYWYRNGSLIRPDGKDFKFDKQYEGDRHLVILNLEMTGRYECRHRLLTRNPCYIVTHKEVSPSTPPNVEDQNSSQKDVTVHTTVDLWCNGTSNDARWYVVHDDMDVDIGIQGKKLQIRNISVDCGTVFRCKLLNDVVCELSLNILHDSKPQQTTQAQQTTMPPIPHYLSILWNGTEQSRVSVPKKENVTLSCRVKGYTNLISKMTWFSFKIKKDNTYGYKQTVANGELSSQQYYRAKADQIGDLKILDLTFIASKETFKAYACEATLLDKSMERSINSSIVNVVKIQ